MTGIDGHARTIRELLSGSKYTIDFYQREYAWQERQVRELIDDLTTRFLESWAEGHERQEVETYGHYFLGSVVISNKRGKRYIVDGQQRLTTLSLLLIFLHHLQAERDDRVELKDLIFSEKFGRKSFNLDVDDRAVCMDKLYADEPFDPNGATESVRNIAARYANVADHFPEEVHGPALPYFVDWLLENVHLVEIQTFSDEDAYTIFETMNDRGLSLSLPEMLKGYVLSNIRQEGDQRTVNQVWKERMQTLRDLGEEEDVDFFKNWLRARRAETIRPGKKGATNKDYERIGSEFHRWVRDHHGRLGLEQSGDFVRFVTRDLDFYSRQVERIRRAASGLTEGLESIRFNEDRGFTLQTQALLAPLDPGDPSDVVERKMALVADYLDIWLARRVWNFRTVAQSSVRYTLFTLSKELRDRSVEELSAYLRQQLDSQQETFARTPDFRLHQQNYRQVRHILARLTYWVDTECGQACHFEDLVSQGRARPFEIEHIWPNKYERFSEWFHHQREFEVERGRLGGLVLLQRGPNQALGDKPYEAKRDAYMAHGESMLTRSLHPLAYQSNPSFRNFIERKELPFKAYEQFDQQAQKERQELYLRLAEWVWNPSRLDLDGLKPPVPEPLGGKDGAEESQGPEPQNLREQMRLRFWSCLLEHVRSRDELHANISPSTSNWISKRKQRLEWSYTLVQHHTRACLYIDNKDASWNEALFDVLHRDREEIEREFGGALEWKRLDDKRASRINAVIDGGWVGEDDWPRVVKEVVDAMSRLHATLAPRVEEALKSET